MGATSPSDQDEKPLELTVQLNGEPVRVGLTWQVDDAEPQAVIVIGVMPDSAAEHAGLKPAERIYQVDGKDFSSSTEFQSLLLTAPIRSIWRSSNKARFTTFICSVPKRNTRRVFLLENDAAPTTRKSWSSGSPRKCHSSRARRTATEKIAVRSRSAILHPARERTGTVAIVWPRSSGRA